MAAEFHLEVMPAPMQRVFATVAPVLGAEGFYLAGGTAVALYYGHRRSVDLDWFREASFEPMALHTRLGSACLGSKHLLPHLTFSSATG